MPKIKKINESDMLRIFSAGETLLKPLNVTRVLKAGHQDFADARIEVGNPENEDRFQFVVECKTRSTPEAIDQACRQVRQQLRSHTELPLIFVPYLSQSKLEKLETEGMSGIDLCGNGIVQVPGKLYVMRTGHPNSFPDSRSVANPYQGRSALVARMLITQPDWGSVTDLTEAIRMKGGQVSISQVSKAIKSFAEELLVTRYKRHISMVDSLRMLDKLANHWKTPQPNRRCYLKINQDDEWGSRLNKTSVRWAVNGQSSVTKYTTFAQGGPIQIAVTNLEHAKTKLNGIDASVPSFANIELVESKDEAFYFANLSENGINWASKIQTWLELRHGDARQMEAAEDVKAQILAAIQHER